MSEHRSIQPMSKLQRIRSVSFIHRTHESADNRLIKFDGGHKECDSTVEPSIKCSRQLGIFKNQMNLCIKKEINLTIQKEQSLTKKDHQNSKSILKNARSESNSSLRSNSQKKCKLSIMSKRPSLRKITDFHMFPEKEQQKFEIKTATKTLDKQNLKGYLNECQFKSMNLNENKCNHTKPKIEKEHKKIKICLNFRKGTALQL